MPGIGVGDVINGDQQVTELRLVADDPETQVSQVIHLMRRYVNEDFNSPQIHRAVLESHLTGDPLYDTFRHVKGVMQFVRDEQTIEPVQASTDLPVVESLVRPRHMAAMPSKRGDCDDYCMYASALLEAQNVPTSFVTIAADGSQPDVYSHVYVVAYPRGGGRVPLDTSHGPHVGWEHPHYFKRREWPIRTYLGLNLLVGATMLYLTYQLLKRERV